MTKKKFDEQELRDFTERQLTSTALDQWISPHEQVRIKAALNKLLDKKYISKKLQQDLKKADQKLFKILRQEIKNPSDEAYTMRKVIDYLYLNRQWDLLESFIHPFLKKNREQKEALYPSYFQGLIHLERNENELAIKFLTESIELEEVKFRDFVIERAAMELGRAYAQTGNYDKVQSSYWAYALASINLERIKKRYALLSKEDFYKLLQESEETLTIDFY